VRPSLYFAYGSNMSPAVMADWCPDHSCLGPARLADHRLAFLRRSIRWQAGAADVVPAPGEEVWGVLYELGPAGLDLLDEKEGGGWAYLRREVEVELPDGSRRAAVTYVVAEKEPREVPPRADYVALLVDAARQRGLPGHYVKALERAPVTG
jgi:gamma-glutamylcyclotransferase